MKKLILLVLIMLLGASITIAQNKLNDRLNKLTNEILENLQSFYPVIATERGIEKYNDRLADYSPKSIKKEISELKKFEQALHRFKKSDISRTDKIIVKLLKSNVDIAYQALAKMGSYKKNPYIYVSEITDGIHLLHVPDNTLPDNKIQNVIARMKAVPGFLSQAQKNLKKPPPLYVNLSRELLTEAIDYYNRITTELAEQSPELADELISASQAAVVAIQIFDSFLAEIDKDKEGSFAIGQRDFEYRIQHGYLLKCNCDSLLKIGEALYARADSAYNVFLNQNNSVWADNDSIFVISCLGKNDIIDYYRWEIDQSRQFLADKKIVTIPDDINECPIVEAPLFLDISFGQSTRRVSGFFKSVQTGFIYFQSITEKLNEEQKSAYYYSIYHRDFRCQAISRGYPGTHLQSQIASRVQSSVTKWQRNPCALNGWALYCEEMMLENGYFASDPRFSLDVLNDIRFAAALVILDIKLHLKKTSPDKATAWLTDNLQLDKESARSIINYIILNPTVAMSSLIGKLEIVALKKAVAAKQGDKISLKDFHDNFLKEGLIPPILLWETWGLRK